MKKSLLKLVTASTVLVLAGCSNNTTASTSANTKDSSEVIATIGDDTISFDEFYAELKAKSGTATLRSMIIQKILEQNVADADALKKSADEEVDAQIQQSGGEKVFEQLLAYQKLGTVDEFRQSVYVRNLFQEVIEKNVDTSEEAIKAFYDEGYSPLMEAQHILVEKEEDAQAILDRLAAGEEFDALAKELSTDSSAKNGGLLSPFKSGQMVPEFEEAVKSVGNGELVSTPVKSKYGYHVIRVINNGEKKPYDEVKEEVKTQYLESKFNDSTLAYSIVGKLIRETGVEIKDKDLTSAVDELLAAVDRAEASASEAASASEETTQAEEGETTAAEEAAEQEETTVEETTAEETTAAE